MKLSSLIRNLFVALVALAATTTNAQQSTTLLGNSAMAGAAIVWNVSTAPMSCGMVHNAERFKIRVSLRTGEDHNTGVGDPNAMFRFRIIGYAMNGTTIVLNDGPYELNLDLDQPEQVLERDLSAFYHLIHYLKVVREDVPSFGYSVAPAYTNYVQLRIDLDKRLSFAPTLSSNCAVMPSAVQNALPTGSNQVTLKWVNNALCPCNIPFANYEVQVLRLYNRDVSLTTEQNISATIDWSQALSIETGSPAQELTLTLAEGTGFYAWRVRAISDFSPGGIADARNWWPWSPNHPAQGNTLPLQRTSAFGTMGTLWESNAFAYRVFYYEQFDKGRNWSFSRVFTEPDPDGATGVRIGERMSFATDLQQVQQEQVHQSVGDVLLATQTVMDFQGRPALQSLPTPVLTKPSLGYVDQLLPGASGNYDATDFDATGTLDNNTQVSTGATTYYLTNSDLQIPSAERLPFSRTTFLPDGTGRVRQVSAPGAEFSFTAGHTPRTARTYYGAVSEQELTSIFGHEAYDRRSVQKMLTVDPNGVTSVTYQDKEGKTLATCLVKTSSLPLEDDGRKQMGLLSEQYADEQETYDLTGGTATDPYTVDVSADIIIPADDTEVEITYTITPSQVQDCADYCSTCDYTITYYLRNTECPNENLIPLLLQNDKLPDPMAYPPPGCNGSPTALTLLTTSVQLDMGSYQVGRIIQVNNQVTGTNTASIPAQTMLQGHLDLLEAQYNADFDAQLAGLVADLESNDLDAFYDDPLVIDNGNGQVAIPLGCDSIRLPKLECPPCVIDADTLLQYFISVYNEAFDPDITTDLSSLPSTFWSDFFSYPESGAPSNFTYSHSTLSSLLTNLTTFDPPPSCKPHLNCEEAWGCWIGAVQGYVAYLEGQSTIQVSGIPGASTLPLVGGAPPAIPDQHLMDMFMGCVKAKIEINYASTTCAACHWLHIWNESNYLEQAYWTVYPAAIGDPCLNAVYDAYSAVVPGLDPNIPGTFESACVSIPGMGLVSLAELINECQQMNFGASTTWTSTEIAAYNAQQNDHMTDCSAACTTATRLAEYEAEIVAAYPGISSTDLTCLRNAMQASCLQTCSNAYPTVTAAPVALPNTDLDNAGMIEFGHPQLTAGACSGSGYNMTGCSQAACLTWVGEVEPASAPDESVALTCEEIQATALLQELLVQRSLQLQEQLDQFTANYLTECAVPDNIEDNLHVEFLSGKHHYTLYFYDRAGSLMSTVPPNDEPLQLDNVPTPPATWPTTDIIYPERTLYRYNSLGQLVMQKTPDGGQTLMAYDRLGRLRFSQNAKQFAMTPTPAYSYTKYDGLGRVVEVGESTAGNAGNDLFDDLVYQLLKAQDPNFPASGTHRTLTTYTEALSGLTFSNGQGQRYLVNRVSWSLSDQDGNTATTADQVVTAYSYDPHGNVDWLVHQLPDVGQRYISYDYDLVSGRVRQLRYNEGFVDQFFQRYSYDEDGRILNAQTSADGVMWDNDARYSYYAHGPLKRTVLGEDQVQGIDHTYTIQGWLKAINAADLNNTDDPSEDSFTGANVNVGRDAFGMMLSYFNGDFKHTGSPFDNASIPDPNTSAVEGLGKHPLYNGNIAAWSWQGQLAETTTINAGSPFTVYSSHAPLAMRYRYDVLNRLRADQPRAYSGATWADDASNAFATSYRYDANGNFKNAVSGAVTRKDAAGGAVDNIGYTYGVPFHPNALASISEGINGAGDDLAEPHDYRYDKIGQLVEEEWPPGSTLMNEISWTPYGKVGQVALRDGTFLRFAYDAAGHRILKAHVTNLNSGLTVAPAPVDEFTYYIHDAQGNLLTTYRRSFTASGPGQITDETRVDEQPLYGSARLGLRTPDNLLVRKLIWNGNTPQVAPIPRVGKAELERLDIPARVAKLKAGDPKVTAGSNFTQTRTYATSPVDKTIPAITAQTINPGTQCINVHRAEDRFGATVFTATTTKQSGVHTLYLMDRNGDLLWNSNGIKAASGAVTHSCQVPGNPMQYYLFTIGDDQKPYVHLIDLSVTVITQGAVLLKNQLLDLGSGTYDRGLAVIDDRTSYGRAMLYAVRRVSGQYTLMGLDLETFTQNGGGQLAPLAASITGSSMGQHGLLQISPDGRELAMVSGSGAPMGMFLWATANIHRYSLSADHTQATFLATYSEGNAAFHYMDYSPAGQYLYFVKSGITLGGATHEVKRQNLTTTVVTSVVRDYGGDIRRTKHGEMLVATPAFLYTDEAFRIQLPNTAAPSIVWGSFTGIDAKAEGAIGLQPLVYELLPAISARSLNHKRYELTDHLGNVRAVVTDRKLCDFVYPAPPSHYRAEVLNQTDFYPFGMISRSTTASGGDYRFSFQGQEKDDEVFGSTGTSMTAEFWQYDTRTGRRWNIDPVDQISISNYAAFGLNPIINVDPNGAIFWEHKNVRQARQVARRTGGEFTKHESGNATVDLSGTQYAQDGPLALRFAVGQDRSDLVRAVSQGDFYGPMQANSTGLDVAKWWLKGLDYDTQPGHVPPGAIQAFIGLNPIVGAANVYNGLMEGKDVYGQSQSTSATAFEAAFTFVPIGRVVRGAGRLIPWTSKSLNLADEAIELGSTEVRVGSRSQAEELFLGKFQGYGYRNTSEMTAMEAKNFFGTKAGSYHWDIGAKAHPHGSNHLQIHTFEGTVLRIYFP